MGLHELQVVVFAKDFSSLFGFQWSFEKPLGYAPLAQLVEQLTLNQWVPGSNP